jgi:RNA polymerase sigma factor (sigma-70 family)
MSNETADDYMDPAVLADIRKRAKYLSRCSPFHVTYADLCQAGHIGYLQAKRKYDPAKGCSLRTFAWTFMDQRMLDESRRGKWGCRKPTDLRRPEHVPPPIAFCTTVLEEVPPWVDDPSIEDIDSDDTFETIVEILDDRHREIVTLLYKGGHTYEQIATRLDLTPRQVGWAVGKALAALRNDLPRGVTQYDR